MSELAVELRSLANLIRKAREVSEILWIRLWKVLLGHCCLVVDLLVVILSLLAELGALFCLLIIVGLVSAAKHVHDGFG